MHLQDEPPLDRVFSIRLQTGSAEGAGELTWARDDAIGFETSLWLSPSDRIEVHIRNPLEDLAVRALLAVRAVSHSDVTLSARCVADVEVIPPLDRRRLRDWLAASARSALRQEGADPIFAESLDRRRLQVTWRTPEAFLRSWQEELSRAAIDLPAPAPVWERLTALLVVPGDQQLRATARVVQEGARVYADFSAQAGVRRVLGEVARRCAARAADPLDTPDPVRLHLIEGGLDDTRAARVIRPRDRRVDLLVGGAGGDSSA